VSSSALRNSRAEAVLNLLVTLESFSPSIKKKQICNFAAGRFIRGARDVLLMGPLSVGKTFLAQAIGHHALKSGVSVLYRSIFDVVRDFLHDEALGGEVRFPHAAHRSCLWDGETRG
jgi:chromosomal replication initiation ATPase DnaA